MTQWPVTGGNLPAGRFFFNKESRKEMKKLLTLAIITVVLMLGCIEDEVIDPPIEPNEPPVVEPNEPNEPIETSWNARMPIRINGKIYIHRMRRSTTTRGVEAEFVPYDQ